MNASRLLAITVCLAACSGAASLSGKYRCGDEGAIKQFDFRKDHVVYMTLVIVGEVPGTFSVDDDKVAITAPGYPGMVLTRKGDTLSGEAMGRLSCTRA